MEGKTKVQVVGIVLIALVFLAANVLVPEKQRTVAYVSSFGFLALLSLLFILSIPLLLSHFPNDFTRFVYANRRWIGIFTFFFAAIHVGLVWHFFFGWNPDKYFQNKNFGFLMLGTVALLITALMAATSNDFAVRTLKKNWKRLQLLVYLAAVLGLVHASNIGLLYMKNEVLKYTVIGVAAVLIMVKMALKLRKPPATPTQES